MRRQVSRRSLLRNEMGSMGAKAASQIPKLSGMFGMLLKENPLQREEQMFTNLWLLLMDRRPKPKERSAGMELLKAARYPDDKADALVDIAWALCQTQEHADLKRSPSILVRGLYKIALGRLPTEEEFHKAVEIVEQAAEPIARSAALEGLMTGLLRSGESQLRREA